MQFIKYFLCFKSFVLDFRLINSNSFLRATFFFFEKRVIFVVKTYIYARIAIKILGNVSKVSKCLNEVLFCIFAFILACVWSCYENYQYKITSLSSIIRQSYYINLTKSKYNAVIISENNEAFKWSISFSNLLTSSLYGEITALLDLLLKTVAHLGFENSLLYFFHRKRNKLQQIILLLYSALVFQ